MCTVCTRGTPFSHSAVTVTSYDVPGERAFRSKPVDVAGSEKTAGAAPLPDVGDVFTRRSLMAQVFGRPVISPLQADDPPCTALFVVHEPMVKVGKSEQVVGCW